MAKSAEQARRAPPQIGSLKGHTDLGDGGRGLASGAERRKEAGRDKEPGEMVGRKDGRRPGQQSQRR